MIRNQARRAALALVTALMIADAGAAQDETIEAGCPPCRTADDACVQRSEPGVGAETARAVWPEAPNNIASADRPPGRVEPAGPIGDTPNDPVDTQGAGLIADNARGIDADDRDDREGLAVRACIEPRNG